MKRVVADVDTGIDDALALLYLAAQEECELVAVGSVHGNVPATTAAVNTLRVLELAGKPQIPVAVGAQRPLAQPLWTAEAIHGADGLGGHAGDPARAEPVAVSAAEQLVAAARAHPGELTVVATGPLTNLALATLLEPRLPQLVERVIVMGGAVEVPGNATPQADANTWHDPEAADLVYGAGYPLTLVGLDVTADTAVDVTWLDKLAACPNEPAQFAASILESYMQVYASIGEERAWLHDPLAAVLALDAGVGQYRQLPIQVELHGQHTRGRTVTDLRAYDIGSTLDDRSPVAVTTTVEADTVLERVLHALCRV